MGGRGYSSATSRRGAGSAGATQSDHYSEAFSGSREQAAEFTRKLLGVSSEEAERMSGAVIDFTETSYVDIRRYQRGETEDPYYEELAKGVEDYINAAPKWGGGETYRGIDVSDAKLKALTTPGAVIDMGGSSSWTTNQEIAKDFADPDFGRQIIFVSKTQRKGTSIRHLSDMTHEDEVLASKDARYKV